MGHLWRLGLHSQRSAWDCDTNHDNARGVGMMLSSCLGEAGPGSGLWKAVNLRAVPGKKELVEGAEAFSGSGLHVGERRLDVV